MSSVDLRLAGVTIEYLPLSHFTKAYDKSGTLFFLDLYYNKAPYYDYNFKISDFEQLSDALAGVRSNFVFSINDHPEMCKTFGGFKIRPVTLSYSAAQCECVKAQELLITK